MPTRCHTFAIRLPYARHTLAGPLKPLAGQKVNHAGGGVFGLGMADTIRPPLPNRAQPCPTSKRLAPPPKQKAPWFPTGPFVVNFNTLQLASLLLTHHEQVIIVFGNLRPQIGVTLEGVLAVLDLFEHRIRRADFGVGGGCGVKRGR